MIRRAPWWLAAVAALMLGQAIPPAPDEAPRSPSFGGANPAVERPTTRIELKSCVTAECHPGVKQHRVLHGPVNVDACDACHRTVDVKDHTFELKRPKQELCGFCHIVDIANAKFVHEPMKTGDCMGCHDPHGGHDVRFLQTPTFGPMCVSCHDDLDYGRHRSVHGPVASGDCGGCHSSHTANHEKLLVRTGRDLCLGCHKEMRQQLAAMPIRHEPVDEGCVSCHDPHASDFRMITLYEPLTLCTNACHDNISTAVTQAQFQHAAVTQEGGCANCHTPHGGELASLMKDRPVNVCLQCHDKPVERDGLPDVPAVANLADPNLYKHGPVRDGSCGGCHEVHGSNHTRLLASEYTNSFYQPFSVEKYDLCFNCHDQALAIEPTVQRVTKFRDGEKNLHYVHVNKTKRGRTCRACHDTHTSSHEKIMRESVPYGKSDWELPIRFAPTPTGGSCASGCHQTMRYDRNQPVNDRLPEVEREQSDPDKPRDPAPDADPRPAENPSPPIEGAFP